MSAPVIVPSLPIPFDGCRPYHLLPYLCQVTPTKIVPLKIVVWNNDDEAFYEIDKATFFADVAHPDDPQEAPGIFMAKECIFYLK